MALVLALEASTYAGSAAVVSGKRVLAGREIAMRGQNEERLMPAVAAVLDDAGVPGSKLSAIVCGSGPGSFTSLRISGSIAKGLAAGWAKPLFVLPSLALMVAGTAAPLHAGRYVASIDALRDEVFAGVYEVEPDGSIVECAEWRRLHRKAIPELARTWSASVIGAGDAGGGVPRASAVARLADWLERAVPVDLDTWEPDYGRKAEAQVRWEAAHGRELPGG